MAGGADRENGGHAAAEAEVAAEVASEESQARAICVQNTCAATLGLAIGEQPIDRSI